MQRKKAANKEPQYKAQDLLIDSDSGSDEELRKTEEQQVIRILEQAKARNVSEKQKKFVNPSREEERTRQFYQTAGFNPPKNDSALLKTKFEVNKTQKVGRWNHYTGNYDKFTPNDSRIYKLTKYDPVYLEERNDPYAPIIPDLNSNRKQPKLFFSLKNTNSESQKQAFSEFLNYYKDASTKAPVTVFEYKNKEKAPEEKQLRKLPSSRSDMTLIKNANITIENREEIPEPSKQKNSYIKSSVRITSVLQSLVEAEKISFEKTKISRFVDEIPRIELLDWRDISKELNATKIEILVIDPVRFIVDNQIEFKAENQEDIYALITHTILENMTFHNEAKYVIAYVYIGESRSIFMKKFVFSVQNNHKYAKGLIDEKEIMLYYQLILGIINQNMRDTTVNPLTIHEIIEKAKDKARAFVKGVGGIPTFLEDWINKKIDPILSLEMTTRNQNGRLTKYNGSFDIKEHFMKTLLKYKKPEEFQAKKSLQELPNILETSKDATNLLAFEPVTGKSSKRIKLIPNPICVNELNNYSPDEREKNSTKDLNESMYSAIHKRQPHLMEFYSPNRNSEGRFRINNLTPLGEHTGRETMLDMKSPKQNFKINSSLTRDKTIYRVQKVLI